MSKLSLRDRLVGLANSLGGDDEDAIMEAVAALASEPAVRRPMREKIAKALCACKSLTPEDVEGDWATPRLREICLHEADAVLELFDEEPDALAEARNDANANYELWKEMRERAERAEAELADIKAACAAKPECGLHVILTDVEPATDSQ